MGVSRPSFLLSTSDTATTKELRKIYELRACFNALSFPYSSIFLFQEFETYSAISTVTFVTSWQSTSRSRSPAALEQLCHLLQASYVKVNVSWKVKPKFFKFVVCNPCQYSPIFNHPCSFMVYYLSLWCFPILVNHHFHAYGQNNQNNND